MSECVFTTFFFLQTFDVTSTERKSRFCCTSLTSRRKMVAPSTQDRLKSFMDKLSIWQLVHGLENKSQTNTDGKKSDCDWMQIFCKDLVELQCVSFLILHICISCIFKPNLHADSSRSFWTCAASSVQNYFVIHHSRAHHHPLAQM